QHDRPEDAATYWKRCAASATPATWIGMIAGSTLRERGIKLDPARVVAERRPPSLPATPAQAPPESKEQAGGGVVRPLELDWEDAFGDVGTLTFIEDYWSFGDDIDVLDAERGLFLMKEKGKARRVYAHDGPYVNFSHAAFDGRYVWVTVESSQAP